MDTRTFPNLVASLFLLDSSANDAAMEQALGVLIESWRDAG